MNGVIGMTGLLLDTELTSEQREYADTVRRSGEGLLTVINDILDFSKVEAGKLSIESVSFDLRLTIEDVDEMLAPRIEDRKLDLVLQYPMRSSPALCGGRGANSPGDNQPGGQRHQVHCEREYRDRRGMRCRRTRHWR